MDKMVCGVIFFQPVSTVTNNNFRFKVGKAVLLLCVQILRFVRIKTDSLDQRRKHHVEKYECYASRSENACRP